MELSPLKIKENLLDALDEDYNVVDMAAVIEVIAILEKIPVSKDLLEETRLGKHINELRKKTKDAALAKRAKNLVRRWRSFILPDQSNQNPLNGERNFIKVKNNTNGSDKSVKSLLNRASQSTSLISFTSKPNSPMRVVEKCISPGIGFSSASNSPSSSIQHVKGLPRATSPPPPPVIKSRPFEGIGETDGSNFRNFKPISPALNPTGFNSSLKRPFTSPLKSNSPNNIDGRSKSPFIANCVISPSSRTCSPLLQTSHSTLDLDRTNAANKRLRKEIDVDSCNDTTQTFTNSVHSPNFSASLVNGLNNNLSPKTPNANPNFNSATIKNNRKRKNDKPEPMESFNKKLAVHAKTPKVKTTAQLLAELQSKNNSPILRSSESVLSEIRQQKGPGDNAVRYSALTDSVAEVKKTKSELMEKFLSSSPSPILDSRNDDNVQVQKESPVPLSSDEQLTHADSPSVPEPCSFSDRLQSVLSQLPDIDPDELDWNDEHELTTVALNNESVERLHAERWPEVNGNFSMENEWSEWHEMITRKSHEDDLLNILPYVNID